MKFSELQVRRHRRNSLIQRVLSICVVVMLVAMWSVRPADAAPAHAWFWLSSDQIRALRDVGTAPVLVIAWKRHTDIIEPPKQANAELPPPEKHPDGQGTMVLGPDYVVIDESGGQQKIYDFKLQRAFTLQGVKTQFTNFDLFARIYFEDAEAQNRYGLGHALGPIGFKTAMWDQPYYEAALGVRTRSVPPLRLTSSENGGLRSFSYNGETLVTVRQGTATLTPQQSAMFAKALRLLGTIHPAAVDALQPLRTLPTEISAMREDGAYQNRNTFRFQPTGEEERTYPLPPGLQPNVHSDQGSNAAFVNRLIDIGLKAVSGASGPRPTRDDYVADESRAYAAGDLLGTGLASFALTTHFPDEPALCQSANAPPRCTRESSDFKAALTDSRFHRIVEASEACSRQPDKAAQLLSGVDASGEKHGYMANYQMYCALRQLSSEQARQLVGRYFVPSASDNLVRALSGNPFIPALYFDAGMWLVGNWDLSGWRIIEIGEALGGGTAKGDAYDKDFSRLKQDIVTRYPERF